MKWKIWIKYKNPWIYFVIPAFLHEWFFHFIYRKLGSKYILIRVLGLQFEFYKQGKDVTQEIINKIKNEL